MSKEVIIFVKPADNTEEFVLPEECEGLFYPLKFDPDEYIKWKNEAELDLRNEILTRNHKDEASLYQELYTVMDRNFVSALDREYMIYSHFLTEPRDPEGKIDTSPQGDAGKTIYPKMNDSDARFGGDFKQLYEEFVKILRACVYGKPCTAPKYILDSLDLDREEMKGEYSLTLDTIPNKSWSAISRWPVMRNFIENRKKLFPEILHLVDMYGEPENNDCIGISYVAFKDQYVDVIDPEDASSIISSLIEKFGVDNVKYYNVS